MVIENLQNKDTKRIEEEKEREGEREKRSSVFLRVRLRAPVSFRRSETSTTLEAEKKKL